ncbi:MAG: hypothetical protein J5598_02195 [Clostridia bacterium]|nr:hypothetical protein [Clostridia bacterium]
MMMGDEYTDDFVAEENDDLNTTYGASVIEDAIDDGGFGAKGMSYYDGGNELTDLDEQDESRDESSEFNNFGDENQFSVTGDENDDIIPQEQDDDQDDMMGTAMSMHRPVVDTNTDDWEDESEEYNDEEDKDEYDDYANEGQAINDLKNLKHGSVITVGGKKHRVYNQGGYSWLEELEPQDNEQDDDKKKEKQNNYNGAIKWKPGDEITIPLLNQIWVKCRLIEKVRPYVDRANEAIKSVLNEMGPNLMLRLNNWIDKLSDNAADTIGSLLDLVKSTGRRMALLSIAAIKGIFDQQHMETFLLATLPNILQTAISTNPVKAILNIILRISVPIINRAAQIA